MITYDLFTKLYGEAKTYDSLEYIFRNEVGRTGWTTLILKPLLLS